MHLVCTLLIYSIMCKWTRPFWGTDCRRAPKSLSSAQAAPFFAVPALRDLESACRVRSTNGLLFGGPAGVTRGGQQQFATQTLRVHLLGLDLFFDGALHLQCFFFFFQFFKLSTKASFVKAQRKFLRVKRGCQASQKGGDLRGSPGNLRGSSRELPEKSGKLSGNSWIAI